MTRGRVLMLIAVSFLVVAGFFVLREHGGHALGLAPYLLLLLCPLLQWSVTPIFGAFMLRRRIAAAWGWSVVEGRHT
jgi:hypothetical protein